MCLLVQAVHARSEQVISDNVNRHAEEQVHNIHRLASGRELLDKVVGAGLEDVQISDTIFDEHGPDQAPAILPQLAIGSEDAVAEEGPPYPVEVRPLSKVGKLRCQDRLDMLRLPGDQVPATASQGYLHEIGAAECSPVEHGIVELQEFVVHLHPPGIDEETDAYRRREKC